MEKRPFLSKIKEALDGLPVGALAIGGAGLAALALCVALWWSPDEPALGVAAALLSAALFATLGLRFAPRWARCWSRAGQPEPVGERARPAELLRVFLLVLAADALTLVVVYAMLRFWNGTESFAQSLPFWRCLDSNSYLEIAQYGYVPDGDRAVQLVFLPGYPLMVRLTHLVVGGDYVRAGLAEAGLCFAGAGAALYALACMDYGRAAARRCVRYLLVAPGALFFAAPMSESQFLLLTLLCVLCVRRKKWLLACVFGGLAAFTRTIGLVMPALVLFELVSDAAQRPGAVQLPRRVGQFAAVLLIPAGFGAYLLVNLRVTGNALQFLVYQREHWAQGLGFFFNTAAYQSVYALNAAREGESALLLGLFLPQLLAGFAALPILTAAVKRLRSSYTAYAIGYYVVAMGCTWLLSGVRYLDALFALPMAMALLCEKRRTDFIVSVLLSLASLWYLWMFAIRWQIW